MALNPHIDLYQELDTISRIRYSEGRGRTEGAHLTRQWCKAQRQRIYRQLKEMGLPKHRPDWLVDAEQQAADYADEKATQRDALC